MTKNLESVSKHAGFEAAEASLRDQLKQGEDALRASRAQLAHELEDTKALQKVSGLLIKEQNGEELYDEILSVAMMIMRADFGSIQLLDQERNELELIAWRNFHPDSARYWARVSADTATSCGQAFGVGSRAVVPDVCQAEFSEEGLAYYLLSGIAAVQSTPLTTRNGRVIGMISTHWREWQAPEDRGFRLLDILARQAADFLERRQTIVRLQQAMERQTLLTAELQHRVRNIFATIRAIAARTESANGSVDDFKAHFEGRISALARTQAILTRFPCEGADLEMLVRDELLALAAQESQLSISGPSLCLSPKAAEVTSLVIHELATNATKYGALTVPKGRITIVWRVETRENILWFALSWTESGCVLQDEASRHNGFGTELITRGLPYELGGTGMMELRPEGLYAEITFPLRGANTISGVEPSRRLT
jgi:two-component sensor histidine kinase